ncbi:MAG: MotA/TolQ/ExbB proton channel family protein [Balneolaceae bacterium]|nr:MotA/TolQ/ExbB proton channel family protein [Balneolaceae bacterium]
MADLFYMGGPFFMGILTIIFVTALATAIYIFLQQKKESTKKLPVSLVKEIGIFALVVGIFAQFLGLFDAFQAIEEMGSVSPALLIGGLKVSSITTLYGFIIFMIAYLLYFWLTTIRREV